MQKPEKYWGPPGELMAEAEIHDFGVEVVLRDLQRDGHEIISVDTDINRNPQIAARIKDRLAFVVVRTAPYPGNGLLNDPPLIDRLIEHAKKHKAMPYFASVGIANSEGVDSGDDVRSARPIRGAGFYVNYRGLQILTSAANVKVFDDGKLKDLIPADLNQSAFSKAAENIAADMGLLDDLPAELANTVANIYYRFWERGIELAPLRAGAPSPAGVFDHPNGPLEGFRQYTKETATAIAGYQCVAGMIGAIRDTLKKHPGRKEIVDYMVQVALDALKYNIENAHEKTPIRRSIERRFKKPNELPGLYDKLRPLVVAFSRTTA